MDGLCVRRQSLHHLEIFARPQFSILAAFWRLMLTFRKSEQSSAKRNRSDSIELQMSFIEIKKEVAQGLTPEEHRQLFQATMILCYLPEHVVSYFLNNF